MRFISLGLTAICVQYGCNKHLDGPGGKKSGSLANNEDQDSELGGGHLSAEENKVTNLESMIGSSSSFKDINVHSPMTEVRALSELDPAIKVVAHYIFESGETVILQDLGGQLLVLKHDGHKYVESKETDSQEVAKILKHEVDVGKLGLMDLTDHLVLKYDTSSGISLGDEKFSSQKDALNNQVFGAFFNPWMRVDPLKGMAEWKDMGLVVFHFQQLSDKETVLMKFNDGRIFSLSRGSSGSFAASPTDAKLAKHILLEIASKRIVTQEVGLHTIAIRDEDTGDYVLSSHDGARFVTAGSELKDDFLGPRLGLNARMMCHTVPKVDSSLEGSLENDYIPLAHYIRRDSDAQMIVTQKISDKSILVLYSDEKNKGILTVDNVPDEELAKFVGLWREFIESSKDFVPQSWQDHTVYEWDSEGPDVAVHDLSRNTATLVAKNSDLPAVKLFVEFILN